MGGTTSLSLKTKNDKGEEVEVTDKQYIIEQLEHKIGINKWHQVSPLTLKLDWETETGITSSLVHVHLIVYSPEASYAQVVGVSSSGQHCVMTSPPAGTLWSALPFRFVNAEQDGGGRRIVYHLLPTRRGVLSSILSQDNKTAELEKIWMVHENGSETEVSCGYRIVQFIDLPSFTDIVKVKLLGIDRVFTIARKRAGWVLLEQDNSES